MLDHMDIPSGEDQAQAYDEAVTETIHALIRVLYACHEIGDARRARRWSRILTRVQKVRRQ